MFYAKPACITVAMLISLTGCAQPDRSDEARVASTALRLLISADGSKVCVDNRTRGEPLAIFRTMVVAPDPARRPLAWRLPSIVESGERLTGRQIVNSQFSGLHPVLAEPDQNPNVLAPIEQFTLNTLARQLARDRSTRSVRLVDPPAKTPIRVRWWAVNRFDPSCVRLVTVSNPVIQRDTAFVSVTSGHWGTTYALRRNGGVWRPAAQWADWLY